MRIARTSARRSSLYQTLKRRNAAFIGLVSSLGAGNNHGGGSRPATVASAPLRLWRARKRTTRGSGNLPVGLASDRLRAECREGISTRMTRLMRSQ